MPAPLVSCSVSLVPSTCFMGSSRGVEFALGASVPTCADTSVALPAHNTNPTIKLARRLSFAILIFGIKPFFPQDRNLGLAQFHAHLPLPSRSRDGEVASFWQHPKDRSLRCVSQFCPLCLAKNRFPAESHPSHVLP